MKRSRAGESGKTEAAITGDPLSLSISVCSRSHCVLVTRCQVVQAYSRACGCSSILGHSQEWADSWYAVMPAGTGSAHRVVTAGKPIIQQSQEQECMPKLFATKQFGHTHSVTKQPSLTQSKLMLGFDVERSRRAGLDPGKITAGINKVVHWICNNCPTGQPHLVVAAPHSCIGLDSGCPCCASRKACICNSLQSLYPALAAEYDTARNDVGPEQVLPRSSSVAA